MNYKFYTTDWYPNGTSDLIIIDDTGEVVEVLSEALFGPPINLNNSVEIESEDDDFDIVGYAYEIPKEVILNYIATSPLEDGNYVVDTLKGYGVNLNLAN